jgi:hypothetical protein
MYIFAFFLLVKVTDPILSGLTDDSFALGLYCSENTASAQHGHIISVALYAQFLSFELHKQSIQN